MRDDSDKILKFVSAMTDKTYQKKIIWELIEAPEAMTEASSNFIGLVYSANINEKRFAIYEEKYKSYSDDFDQVYWANTYVLCIVNENFFPIHIVCTGTSMLYDLFNAVTAQVSGVDDIIDSLIDDLDDL